MLFPQPLLENLSYHDTEGSQVCISIVDPELPGIYSVSRSDFGKFLISIQTIIGTVFQIKFCSESCPSNKRSSIVVENVVISFTFKLYFVRTFKSLHFILDPECIPPFRKGRKVPDPQTTTLVCMRHLRTLDYFTVSVPSSG
jgi:hypothetical protein